jgi:hypothetical protein
VAKIGEALPQFVDMVRTFSSKDAIKALLALFYRDVLDFYVLLLKFVKMSRKLPMQIAESTNLISDTKYLFEAIWPKHKAKVDVVVSNIERHALLMRNEVTLEHTKEEHEARTRALAHFEQTKDFQELGRFQALMTRVLLYCMTTGWTGYEIDLVRVRHDGYCKKNASRIG